MVGRRPGLSEDPTMRERVFLGTPDRFLVTSGFSLASQSKTVTKGEDARRENPKGNKEIWESREMS